MSESRPNQAGQTGMALLIIVILFGMLFLGVGGVLWLRVRAQHTAVEDALKQARYQEQIAREQAEAALRRAEEARNLEQLQQDQAESKTAVTDTAPAAANDPAPDRDVKVHVP